MAGWVFNVGVGAAMEQPFLCSPFFNKAQPQRDRSQGACRPSLWKDCIPGCGASPQSAPVAYRSPWQANGSTASVRPPSTGARCGAQAPMRTGPWQLAEPGYADATNLLHRGPTEPGCVGHHPAGKRPIVVMDFGQGTMAQSTRGSSPGCRSSCQVKGTGPGWLQRVHAYRTTTSSTNTHELCPAPACHAGSLPLLCRVALM